MSGFFEQLDSAYREALSRDETFLANVLLLLKLQILDLAGTLVMINKFGLESEANKLAQTILAGEGHLPGLSVIKVVAVPLVVFLASGAAYVRFKRKYQQEGQLAGWAERVTILLQAINTLYMLAFLIIFIANAHQPLQELIDLLAE